ncbi:unnamed protein product [Pleuronectes platessa]|uniref:Uncharacterized protein n=1 Tax=Pleuronectes platessa TaxID=8262 RepID=A0A9N7YJU6_PLEPL|nr:unnamed protein product [Pleuronectes platessa]
MAPLSGALGPAYLWAPPENCFLIKIELRRVDLAHFIIRVLGKSLAGRETVGSGEGGRSGGGVEGLCVKLMFPTREQAVPSTREYKARSEEFSSPPKCRVIV